METSGKPNQKFTITRLQDHCRCLVCSGAASILPVAILPASVKLFCERQATKQPTLLLAVQWPQRMQSGQRSCSYQLPNYQLLKIYKRIAVSSNPLQCLIAAEGIGAIELQLKLLTTNAWLIFTSISEHKKSKNKDATLPL